MTTVTEAATTGWDPTQPDILQTNRINNIVGNSAASVVALDLADYLALPADERYVIVVVVVVIFVIHTILSFKKPGIIH